MNTQRRTLLFALSVASLLSACGFQLRGKATYGYAFQTLFSGFTPGSPIGVDFKRQATGQGLTVMDDAASANAAQVVLRVHLEQRERVVVGTGVSGQVNAVQLRVRFRFSLFTTQGKTLLDEVEILQEREQSYSESAALAKEAEEQLLYRDMQQDIVQQLMRRLSAVKSL
jgi:LPS-assembly lipoprotein